MTKPYHNRDHQGINRMKPNIIYYNAALIQLKNKKF